MYIDFYKIIKSYISFNKGANILILEDSYYSELPFKLIEDTVKVSKLIDEFTEKKIDIINNLSDFNKLNKKYDLIINLYFSSKSLDQISFTNKILSLSFLKTEYILILPFIGFVNYGVNNFNPIFFKAINKNDNFDLREISFLSTNGHKLKIEDNFIDKIFFQSTSKKNQNFTDLVYNELVLKFKECSILFRASVIKTEVMKLEYYETSRLGSHLSGHGGKTWVDEGALKTILKSKKINSLIDIGCGPGGMVDYSNKLGIKSIGIDGDDSIIRSNNKTFKIHDFTKGYFTTNETFDLGWCVEFLEHVDVKFTDNYFDTFKKCKYIFCTYAPKDKRGYNHVNTQDEDYWLKLFLKNNFLLDRELTEKIRTKSTIEKNFVRQHGLFFRNQKFKN